MNRALELHIFYMTCLNCAFHERDLKPFHFLRVDLGEANCKRQLKFIDFGLEQDENGKRSNYDGVDTKNLAAVSENQVSLQSEEAKESGCNGQESLAGLGTLNVLEQTPLASSTPCKSTESSEEADTKAQVFLIIFFFVIFLQTFFLENSIYDI